MYPENADRSIAFTHLYVPKVSTAPIWRGSKLRGEKFGIFHFADDTHASAAQFIGNPVVGWFGRSRGKFFVVDV